MRMLAIYALIIFVPIMIIMAEIFRFFITSNEMKPNKLTKLFYSDDESFIKSWEIAKEKGMLMFNLKNVIFFTAWYGMMCFFIFSKDNYSIMYAHEHILLLVITIIIFGLISSISTWGVEHKRYIKLKEKTKNDNIKNLKE